MHLYVVSAFGDEAEAAELVAALRAHDHEVSFEGSVPVGTSYVAHAHEALTSNIPVVLCATRRAAGSEWVHKLADAASQQGGKSRLFAVKMEEDVFLGGLTFGEREADWASDREDAVSRLSAAIIERFSPRAKPSPSNDQLADVPYMEQEIPLSDLDAASLASYRNDVRDTESYLKSPSLSQSDLLRALGVVSERGRSTRTTALLFAMNPVQFVRSAIVQCSMWQATTADSEDRLTQRFVGPLKSQVDSAFEFVQSQVATGEKISGSTVRSETTYSYPMACIREVIVNAVVHRDYEDPTRHVHVRLYSDRLEVLSPGGWVETELGDDAVPLSNFRGESLPRNPSLAHALSIIRYFEGEGSGVSTAVRDSRLRGAAEPSVEWRQGFTVVTVFPSRFAPELTRAILDAARLERADSLAVTLPSGLTRDEEAPFISPRLLGSDSETIDWTSLISADNRLTLLVGPFASGKTTALLKITQHLAIEPDSPLPVFVRARSLLDVKSSFDATDLEWLETIWRETLHVAVKKGAASAILDSIPTVILVDGLDEMLSVRRRLALLKMLETLPSLYPACSVIVSTRDLGGALRESSDFAWHRVRLAPWDQEQVDAYILQRLRQSDSGLTAADIRGDDGLGIVDSFADSPLLLDMLIDIWIRTRTLPPNQFSLLQSSVELSMELWDTARRIPASQRPSRQRSAIERIAYSLSARRDSAESTYFRLDWAADILADSYGSAADELLIRSALITPAGVSRDGVEQFRFTHRLFQEFLSVNYLLSRRTSPQQLALDIVELASLQHHPAFWTLLLEGIYAHGESGGAVLGSLVGLLASGDRDYLLEPLLREVERLVKKNVVPSLTSSVRSGALMPPDALEIDALLHNRLCEVASTADVALGDAARPQG